MNENVRQCVKCHKEVNDLSDPHYKQHLLCENCYQKTERN
jgi:hypothetical protein